MRTAIRCVFRGPYGGMSLPLQRVTSLCRRVWLTLLLRRIGCAVSGTTAEAGTETGRDHRERVLGLRGHSLHYTIENLYFTRMNISGIKTNGNNKLTNLTININSQHIERDESRRHVKLYRAKQSLAIDCHTIQLPQFRDCMTYSAFRCTIS